MGDQGDTYGYRTPGVFRTIMAYPCDYNCDGCARCDRILMFSNPTATYAIEDTNYNVQNPDLKGTTCFGVGWERLWHAGEDLYRTDGKSTAGAEVMAIGRTFKESLQKALRSLEIGRYGLGGDGKPWRFGEQVYGDRDIFPRDLIVQKLSIPNAERVFFLRHALRAGVDIEEIYELTRIDRWFLAQIKEIVDFEEELAGTRS